MSAHNPRWGSTGRGAPPQSPPNPRAALKNARRLQLIRELQEEGQTPAAIFALVQITMKRDFPDA